MAWSEEERESGLGLGLGGRRRERRGGRERRRKREEKKGGEEQTRRERRELLFSCRRLRSLRSCNGFYRSLAEAVFFSFSLASRDGSIQEAQCASLKGRREGEMASIGVQRGADRPDEKTKNRAARSKERELSLSLRFSSLDHSVLPASP